VIGYAVDITKEKETMQLLRKTEKLSVVGELAASVAHEIRNPLTALKGFLQMLQSSSDENQMYYKIMLEEIERINIISSELLVLAKPQQIHFQKRNINELLSNVKSLLESEANLYGVELEIFTNDKLPLVDCEPNQLKQLFINIIKNSIEATSKKVKVSLNKIDNDHICILFKDDGCGIDQDRLKHLGEPFYSMKEKGTGLGLTVSYRIVEFHKGQIQFESKVNEGTTVRLVLPIKK
jgi:signal transduction histidine kinase